jgi:hypothetical protein
VKVTQTRRPSRQLQPLQCESGTPRPPRATRSRLGGRTISTPTDLVNLGTHPYTIAPPPSAPPALRVSAGGIRLRPLLPCRPPTFRRHKGAPRTRCTDAATALWCGGGGGGDTRRSRCALRWAVWQRRLGCGVGGRAAYSCRELEPPQVHRRELSRTAHWRRWLRYALVQATRFSGRLPLHRTPVPSLSASLLHGFL